MNTVSAKYNINTLVAVYVDRVKNIRCAQTLVENTQEKISLFSKARRQITATVKKAT